MTDDILKVRVSIGRSLHSIEQLALDLHAQALNDHSARDFPGGTALHMLAPAAVLQDWEALYEAKESAERFDKHGRDRWLNENAKKPTSNLRDPAVYQSEDDAAEHPVNVLATWVRMIREERDQPTPLPPTLTSELAYISRSLDWVCRVDADGDPEWPLCFELQAELKALVRRMEDVLRAGERPDLSKAKCNRCDAAPRLHKQWKYNPADDRWQCPNCKEPFDNGEAARALGEMLFAEGSEKFVWIHQARDVAGVDRRTWHSWYDRMKMQAACDIKTKQVIVWWPAVRELVREHRIRVADRAIKQAVIAARKAEKEREAAEQHAQEHEAAS